MSPALLETAPPLNARGRVELVSPRAGARVILEPDEEVFDSRNNRRIVRRGRQIKFENSRAECTLEEFELLQEHPMFTGDRQPKEIFLAHERPVLSGRGGIQVVDGGITSASGERMDAPLPDWDRMTPAAMRRAVTDGKVESPVDALLFERRHRNREWAIRLLGAAIGGAELPHTNALNALAKQQPAPEPEEEPEAEEPPAAVVLEEDVREAVQNAIRAAEGAAPIAPEAAEPIPGEGVV